MNLLTLLVSLLIAATPIPDPAPRVPFPADYAETFESIRVANKTAQTLLGTIYANERAASVKDLGGLPYPNGSVIVMEWAQPLKDDLGALLLDADGLWRKGTVVRVDVMRRESGYGERYGDKRAGEWEFASYRPDGTLRQPIETAASCAECHRDATAGRDFVFRGRFAALEK